MEFIRRAMLVMLAERQPMTVRQVFYQLVVHGIVRKTENEYSRTVGRLLTEMRKSGRLPHSWIADGTRWVRKPPSHSSLAQFLESAAALYRRNLWDKSDSTVEIWCESEALAGVIADVTREWDVGLYVTRGYSSETFLAAAAAAIRADGRPAYIYQFGDYDPRGLDIHRHIEDRIRKMAPASEIHFERSALTPGQINMLDLPSRPPKRGDTLTKSFRGECVELDAMEPELLKALVSSCIQNHVDPEALKAVRVAEESEREMLEYLAMEAG